MDKIYFGGTITLHDLKALYAKSHLNMRFLNFQFWKSNKTCGLSKNFFGITKKKKYGNYFILNHRSFYKFRLIRENNIKQNFGISIIQFKLY